MPLSEQEQRLLEEMERSLYQNDADFVPTSTRRGRTNYTWVVLGVLITVVGIAGLVAGVAIRQPVVGIAGFAIMFAGVLLAVAPPRRLVGTTAEPESRTRPTGRGAGFMDTLEERWDRRQEGRD